MEKAVLNVISAELKVKQPRIYKIAKENYIRDLISIGFEKVKKHIQSGQLNEKEFEELYSRRNTVLVELEKKPVDLCPKARWFYNEIVDTVNTYFVGAESVEDTIDHVIECFEREFRYKACAKKIVYTTIAENLILQDERVPDHIINEIKDGYFDNSQFELTEEESQDLSKRIVKVLDRLDITRQ
ncbi:Imm3 family immunity protein [Paenibacillus lautus]